MEESDDAFLARVRTRQWQAALRQCAVMRAELVRLGVTDPRILGPEVLEVRGGVVVELLALTAADEPDYRGFDVPQAITPEEPRECPSPA